MIFHPVFHLGHARQPSLKQRDLIAVRLLLRLNMIPSVHPQIRLFLSYQKRPRGSREAAEIGPCPPIFRNVLALMGVLAGDHIIVRPDIGHLLP